MSGEDGFNVLSRPVLWAEQTNQGSTEENPPREGLPELERPSALGPRVEDNSYSKLWRPRPSEWEPKDRVQRQINSKIFTIIGANAPMASKILTAVLNAIWKDGNWNQFIVAAVELRYTE